MHKRRIRIVAMVTMIFVAIPIWLYTYSESTTHPALTWEMVELFNRTYPDLALNTQEREWVIKGSEDEDTWPRWINHFYNPETNLGWQAEYFGRLPSGTAQNLTKLLLSDYPPVPASYWAVMPNIQAQYKSFGGNRTWQRALSEWSQGNRKEAYYTLGHILHLLEDMTVPDHTRDDTHAHPLQLATGDIGSPYELYAKQFMREKGKTNLPVTAELLVRANLLPIMLPTLASYFDLLANYSHYYFFSKDTIFRYALPKIVSSDDEYGYGKDKDGSIFPLVRKRLKRAGFTLSVAFTLDDPVSDAPILKNYITKLSREAIRSGAGVMKLFRNEADTIVASGKSSSNPVEKNGVDSTLNTLKHTTEAIVWLDKKGEQAAQKAGSFLDGALLSLTQAVQKVTPQVLGEKIQAEVVLQSVPLAVSSDPVVLPMTVNEEVVLVQPFSSPYSSGSGGVSIAVAPTIEVGVEESAVETFVPTINEVAVNPVSQTTSTVVVSATVLLTQDEILVTSTTSSTTSTSSLGDSPIVSTTTSTEEGVILVTTTTATIIVTTTIEIISSTLSVVATTSTSVIIATSTVVTTTPIANETAAHVVFNEIAWAGTSSNYPNDEWFELYNSTDEPVDIKGWKIMVGDVSMFWQKTNNTIIESHGYLLFEKKRDETVRDITADVVYSDITFHNTGDMVTLRDATDSLVDQVNFSTGWPGETNYRSLERIHLQTDFDSADWQPSNDFRMVGKDYAGGIVYGSPRLPNSGNVALNFRQEELVRVLTKDENPYLLGYYEIPTGAKLVIEPGVVIKSYHPDSKIDVFGELITKDGNEKIIMTSGKAVQAPGDWQGVWFHSGSSGNLINLSLSYAGKQFRVDNALYTGFISQAIRAEQSNLVVSGSEFAGINGTALYLENTPTTINNASFKKGERAIVSHDSLVEINSNVFKDFTDPSGPVQVHNQWPKFDNLIFENNGFNGPYIVAASITKDETFKAAWPYHLSNIIAEKESTLSIDAGAELRFDQGATLIAKNSILVNGTSEAPVKLLPFDPALAWGSLRLENAKGEIKNVFMSGGNANYPITPDRAGMVMLNASELSISDSTLLDVDNAGNTLFSNHSQVHITNSTVGHSEKRLWPTAGVGLNGGSLYLDTVIFKNLETGIKQYGLPLAEVYESGENQFLEVGYPHDPPLFTTSTARDN